MRGLKTLVIVMGVLLVAGVAVLAGAIAVRLKGPPAAAFTAAPLDIPAGARVEAMSTGPDRVVLALILADGTRQLVVVDLASGRKLGTIPLR